MSDQKEKTAASYRGGLTGLPLKNGRLRQDGDIRLACLAFSDEGEVTCLADTYPLALSGYVGAGVSN